MVTENYTMKEIIKEALVRFDLNRVIDQNDKAEVSKLFSIPVEHNILFFSKNEDYVLVMTDFVIYYEPTINKILRTENLFSFILLWYEIESVSKKMQNDFLILTLSTQEKEFRIFLEPSLVSDLISYIITKKK